MSNSVFTTRDIVKYLIILGVIYIILKVIFDKPKNAKQPTIKTEETKSTEGFIPMTKAGRDAEALRVLTSPFVNLWNKRKAKK
jgi:hypothetical protein